MDYIKLAILAGLFVIGFGSGAALTYKIEHAKITELELVISDANNQAYHSLQIAKDKVLSAENEAKTANLELESARESSIKTINAIDSHFDTIKLRDPYRKNCRNTMPETNNTGNIQTDETDGTELSTEFREFLQSETLRANLAAVDKNALLKFVQDNCGIK